MARWISFFTAEIAIVILLAAVMILLNSAAGIRVNIYFDILNLLVIFCMVLVVTASAGMLGDLGRAFRHCVSVDAACSAEKIQRAVSAVKLTMVTALVTGAGVTLMRMISLLYSETDSLVVRIIAANALTDLLSSLIIVLLLFPVYGRLKKDACRFQAIQ